MWFVFTLTPALLLFEIFLINSDARRTPGRTNFAGTGQGFPCPDAW
jgi:hypothetical protein